MSLSEAIIQYVHDAHVNPSVLGELLRAWAFPGAEYGCYSTFEVRPECVKVKATPREFYFLWGRDFCPEEMPDPYGFRAIDAEEIDRIVWYRHPTGIEFGWHWDGDGALAFYVPELAHLGSLLNADCKHSDEWIFEELAADLQGQCKPAAGVSARGRAYSELVQINLDIAMSSKVAQVIDTAKQVFVTSLLIFVSSAMVLVPFIAMGLALRGY